MKTSPRVIAIAAFLALAGASPARAQVETPPGGTLNLYRLIETAPLASLDALAAPNGRIESTAVVGGRHQLRLSTHALRLTPPPDAAFVASLRLDPARATWRYAVLEEPGWALRLGLTSNVGALRGARSTGSGDRTRFGSLPMLHVAGEGLLARGWLVGFDADGLATHRGRALELGVRVGYRWAGNFSLYGGYRLSEANGEAEDAYAAGSSNAASIGLWYRF